MIVSTTNDASSSEPNATEEIIPKIVLSVLIPVYNEQAYLSLVVDRVLAAPLPEGVEKELVLVDDCSTDRSPEIIKELAQKYPNLIKAYQQPRNQGKGAAIRRAVKEMTGDYAIIQDADLEYDPNEYSLVIAPLLDGRADVVYGSRYATRETRKVLQFHHKLGNLFLTYLSNFMTGLDLTDMETCYKAFRADALNPFRYAQIDLELSRKSPLKLPNAAGRSMKCRLVTMDGDTLKERKLDGKTESAPFESSSSIGSSTTASMIKTAILILLKKSKIRKTLERL